MRNLSTKHTYEPGNKQNKSKSDQVEVIMTWLSGLLFKTITADGIQDFWWQWDIESTA